MKNRVQSRKPFLMTFWGFCCSNCIVNICCFCGCLNKVKCMQRKIKVVKQREELLSRLNLEIDLVEIVRRARLTKFISQITLSKFQRSLIPSFKNYNLNSEDTFRVEKLQTQTVRTYPVDLYLKDFQPETNVADNMILYQITGKQKQGEGCNFDHSTDDEDENVQYEAQYTNYGKRKSTKFKQSSPLGSVSQSPSQVQTRTSLLDKRLLLKQQKS